MDKLIQNTREIFGASPRKFSFFDGIYNKLRKPSWMGRTASKHYSALFRDQRVLLSEGRVVWGTIVQANELLFRPGKDDHPAAAVYSDDLYYDSHLDELERIAHLLFELKGSRVADPELLLFADVITDEYTVLFEVRIPKSITDGRNVYFTTIMVSRKHLPLKYLHTNWFPLLISPERKSGEIKTSMIVPSKYWDKQLVSLWSADQEADLFE